MSTLAEPEVPTTAPSAVVEYSATEAALADLRSRYQNVVFDVATTKGDKAAAPPGWNWSPCVPRWRRSAPRSRPPPWSGAA